MSNIFHTLQSVGFNECILNCKKNIGEKFSSFSTTLTIYETQLLLTETFKDGNNYLTCKISINR